MIKAGIVLSGCGVFDGSEIHESTLLAYFLTKTGVQVSFLAPNINQDDVVNHQTQEASTETRNVCVESARIARGPVTELSGSCADDLDFAIFAGGFGAAKTLSTYAKDGKDLQVLPAVRDFCLAMADAQKGLGFLCISPVIAASLFPGAILTLGVNQDDLDLLDTMGAQSRQALAADLVTDSAKRLYSTPAYMCDASIADIAVGIELLATTMTNDFRNTKLDNQPQEAIASQPQTT